MKIFSEELVEKAVKELHIANLAQATIGDVLLVAQYLEKETGIPFIRMDQGSPGLAANQIGIEAEKAALDRGVGSQYPAAAGVPELKKEASRFVKAFLNLDISPRACVPTTGSVAGSFGSFIACTQRIPGKDKVLFIDPGFPIQKSQLRIIGVEWEEFDIYHYRGQALREKLESFLSKGDIAAIIYSNPNNPAWICLEESELKIIGELATQYDVIVLEDQETLVHPDKRNTCQFFQAGSYQQHIPYGGIGQVGHFHFLRYGIYQLFTKHATHRLSEFQLFDIFMTYIEGTIVHLHHFFAF